MGTDNLPETDVDLDAETVRLEDANGDEVAVVELQTGPSSTDNGLTTALAAALAGVGDDQLRVDLENNNAGNLPVDLQADNLAGNLDVDIAEASANVTTQDATFSGLNFGEDTVATSGAAEALNGGTSLSIAEGARLTVRALSGNSNSVYVGDSTVTTSDGFQLEAGESVSLNIDDVSTAHIDVDTDGEGVRWIVEA